MSTTVKLSEDAVAWADRKVASGEYESRSAYFEAQAALERAYEDRLTELRRLIQEGEDSGVSDATVDSIWQEVAARHDLNG